MKKIIIIVIVLIVAVAATYAYQLYQQKTPDVVNRTPDVKVSAKDLLDAFMKDTAAARKMFVDKIVEVTGNVKRIDTSGAIVLGEQGSAMEITIGLDRRHVKDYEKLKEGLVAVLQGICSGSTNNSISTDPTDLLASLGTTVELRSAGVKQK